MWPIRTNKNLRCFPPQIPPSLLPMFTHNESIAYSSLIHCVSAAFVASSETSSYGHLGLGRTEGDPLHVAVTPPPPPRRVLQRVAANETDAADGLTPSSACAAPDGGPLRASAELKVSIRLPHPSTNPDPYLNPRPSSTTYQLHRRHKAHVRPRLPSSTHSPFSCVLIYFLDKNMSEEGLWRRRWKKLKKTTQKTHVQKGKKKPSHM